MLRYLKAAFWEKVAFSAIGPVPVNALAVLGVAALGLVEPVVWLGGAALEAAYLVVLANNERYRRLVRGRELLAAAPADEAAAFERRRVLAELDPEAARRHTALAEAVQTVRREYRVLHPDSLVAGSNVETLDQLVTIHHDLSAARARLLRAEIDADAPAQRRRAEALERELSDPALPAAVRDSKQATLDLMRRRLEVSERRRAQAAETAAQLERIEAQVSLAREDAATPGPPAAVRADLEAAGRVLEANREIASLSQSQ